MNKLSKIIAEVWNRANRVFPRITGARILRFLIHSDDGFTLEEADTESLKIPYPARWAPDTGQDPNTNARWIGGEWGSGTAASGTVSTSDNILAAQWNNLITELETHNHDGTHGKQLVNDSIEDYSLTYEAFAGGTASVFLQPVSSYTGGSATVTSSDPGVAYIPSPTANLNYPGTAYFAFQPPWAITTGQISFDIFYGAPTTASGTINFTVTAYRDGTSIWTQSLSVDASTLATQASSVGNASSYSQYSNYTFVVQRDSDSCSYALLVHGVLLSFKVRP